MGFDASGAGNAIETMKRWLRKFSAASLHTVNLNRYGLSANLAFQAAIGPRSSHQHARNTWLDASSAT